MSYRQEWRELEEENHDYVEREYKAKNKVRERILKAFMFRLQELFKQMKVSGLPISLAYLRRRIPMELEKEIRLEAKRKSRYIRGVRPLSYDTVINYLVERLDADLADAETMTLIFLGQMLSTWTRLNGSGMVANATRGLAGAAELDGITLAEHLKYERTKFCADIKTTIKRTLISGSEIEPLMDALKETVTRDENRRKKLATTFATYFTVQAMVKAAAKDGYKYVKVIEHKDMRTCVQCAEMNGRIIPVADARMGVTVPPFHMHCRGHVVPCSIRGEED